MVKLYSLTSCKALLLTVLVSGAFLFSARADDVDTTRHASRGKLTDTRKNKPEILTTGVKINFTPFKPAELKPVTVKPVKPAQQAPSQDPKGGETKVVSNLKVFPNPVDDQLNLSYHVSKSTNVVIKVMDILGNEVSVLMSQKVQAGEQLNTYNVANKLNKGFYFVHIIAGNELQIRRISVL